MCMVLIEKHIHNYLAYRPYIIAITYILGFVMVMAIHYETREAYMPMIQSVRGLGIVMISFRILT